MVGQSIGRVTHVDNSGIQVEIDHDREGAQAEDRIHRLGELGSYLTVPIARGKLVGLVMEMTRGQSAAPGTEPPVWISAHLIGTLKDGRFLRGVYVYPVVGDQVLAATQEDFEAILGTVSHAHSHGAHAHGQAGRQSKRRDRFSLGKFAHNDDFEVLIRGKEFFSKHIFIAGNTGSGKSCTTARILQEIGKLPNSQVLVFDMHDEYRAAFTDSGGRLADNVTYMGMSDLILPYWLLKFEEIEELFVDRSNPVHAESQSSFLRMALQKLKGRTASQMGLESVFTLDTPIYYDLRQLSTYAENLNDARYVLDSDRLAFADISLRTLPSQEQEQLMLDRRCEFHRGQPMGETVHPLYYGKLVGLVNRIDTLLNDCRYDFVFNPLRLARDSKHFREALAFTQTPAELSNSMSHLLNLLIGRLTPHRNITIVDLSGVPFDMTDLCVGLVTRLVFDFNFWSPPADRHPLVMVYEEAHNYIPVERRERSLARQAVERVIKEGRKYGVTAVVVSQRPSEISETVLSQCSNMVVLRMNNPADQEYIAKVVSNDFGDLVRVLPSLRPGEAFVIGDSVVMPMRTLVRMPDPQPHSSDLDVFEHWTGNAPRTPTDNVVNAWWRQERQDAEPAPEPATA